MEIHLRAGPYSFSRSATNAGGARARFFAVDQVRAIIAATAEPWKTFFTLAAMTGMRAGELLGLQITDLDFERRLIQVWRSAWYGKAQSPKTARSVRTVPMPESLARILEGYVERWQSNPDGYLFVTRNDRPPSSNNVVEHRLWPILDALKIPRCGLHAFRHTHSSMLVESGAPVSVAQAQLGHTDPSITLGIYFHVIGDSQRRAVEKVAGILDYSGLQTEVKTELIQISNRIPRRLIQKEKGRFAGSRPLSFWSRLWTNFGPKPLLFMALTQH
jgi:integrase